MCLKLARYDGPKVFCIGGEPANIYVASPLELVVSSAPEEVRDEVFRDFKRQYETDPKIRFTQVFRMLDLYLFYHVHRNRESEMSSQQRPQKQKLMA
jgi:hypothetical protein